MFLNQLNEDQKELFLQLCSHAVMADDVFEVDEMESIALFCHEMMIPNHMPDMEEPFDSVLEKINETASAQQKNIMILELILLLKKDGTLDETEKYFLSTVKTELGVSNDKYFALDGLANIYLSLYNELNRTIDN